MANVEWASKFFNAVTSRLPDLLTEAGEGKELEAFDKLRAELGDADKKVKAKRAVALQAELDQLNGKAPAVAIPEGKDDGESKPMDPVMKAAAEKASRGR